MKVSRAVLIYLTVVCFTAGLAHAQVIRGKVLIPTVQVPEHMEVLLEKGDGQVIVRAFSDSTGNFEMRGMPVGGYDIVVRVEGYEEARLRVDVTGGTLGATLVNIPLERKENRLVNATDDNSIVDVTELNRNYPKKVLQEYDKAREENRKGDLAPARERLEGVLKLEPDFYSAHALLGTIYQKLERFPDAEIEYQRAKELNPRSAQPLINLGSLYIQESDAPTMRNRRVRGRVLDDALDALDEAAKLDPHSALAFYLSGVAYYKSGFLEVAETNLKRALELDAHLPSTRLMLVNLYVRQEMWDLALEQVDAYLEENPKAENRVQLQETRSKITGKLAPPK